MRWSNSSDEDVGRGIFRDTNRGAHEASAYTAFLSLSGKTVHEEGPVQQVRPGHDTRTLSAGFCMASPTRPLPTDVVLARTSR